MLRSHQHSFLLFSPTFCICPSTQCWPEITIICVFRGCFSFRTSLPLVPRRSFGMLTVSGRTCYPPFFSGFAAAQSFLMRSAVTGTSVPFFSSRPTLCVMWPPRVLGLPPLSPGPPSRLQTITPAFFFSLLCPFANFDFHVRGNEILSGIRFFSTVFLLFCLRRTPPHFISLNTHPRAFE